MRAFKEEDRVIYKHKYDAKNAIRIDVLDNPSSVGNSERQMFSRYVVFDPTTKVIKDETYYAVQLSKDQAKTLVDSVKSNLPSIQENNEGKIDSLPKF